MRLLCSLFFLVGFPPFFKFFLQISPIISVYVRYNETEARNFLNLAAAAYPEPKNTTARQQCLEKTFPGEEYSVLVALTVACDKKQNPCQAYIAVSNVSKTIVLSFRGTEGTSQLTQELRYGLQDYMPYMEMDRNGNYSECGRVNKYFYRAMDAVWSAMIQPIIDRYPGYRYLVTGHSLGGALAALTAFRLSFRGVVSDTYQVRLITFGEPREGDYDYSVVFQQYVPYSFRLVHYTDPVPHLPPLHEDDLTGPAYPFHHTREIWYNKAFDSYTQCNSTFGEDATCSDQKRFWNYGSGAMSEHLIYFNHYISEYGWAGCQDASPAAATSPTVILLSSVVLFHILHKFL